jgi:hypothetical protein
MMRSSARMKWLTLAAVVASASVAGVAQAEPPASWGGFGHAMVSGHFGTFGALESSLRHPAAVGPDFTLNDIVLGAGGGGKALLAGILILGGRGTGWYVPSSGPDDIDVTVVGGGGGFEIGIAAFNRDHFLLYPYLGVHGYGVDVEIDNKTTRAVMFGQDALESGNKRTYQSGLWAAEFGIGLQRFLFWRHGGFMVGAEGGLLTSVVQGDWHDADGNEVRGLQKFGFSGGFIRLTLGGGGFRFEGDDDGES